MSRLLGIAIRPRGEDTMHLLEEVSIATETGIAGDKHSQPGKRQVTVLNSLSWQQVCTELRAELSWTTRRANLLIDDIELQKATGKKIVIGDVILEITGETDPCKQMEEAHPGLLRALVPDWRGGVTCRVVQAGRVRVGMDVRML